MLQDILSALTQAGLMIISFYRSVDMSFGGLTINAFDLFVALAVISIIWNHFSGGDME